MGRRLGDPTDPLLVSVRSGAKSSMPGMMETVLDVGLNDVSVLGLARQSGSDRFAWDSYRRLVQMFGATVLGVDSRLFAQELDAVKTARGATQDLELTTSDLKQLVTTYTELIESQTGQPFPQDPHQQLHLAVTAVFDSWHTDRARRYRRQEHIAEDLGTAVNVQVMVFGNRGARSGSGVCFTRDPATGHRGVYGDYLTNAQGEDVVAGIRNTVPLTDLADLDPTSYEQLLEVMTTLERHYQDLCDIEFTVEDGRLWVLQTRVGKRTPQAAFRIAADLVREGIIDVDQALSRVTGDQLARLMFPSFDPGAERVLLTRGVNASPGAAVGRLVFDSPTAEAWVARGEDVILVREETDPDDLPGLIAARGVLTSRGGRTSHAAVVARGLGRTCVCGADELRVDAASRIVRVGDIELGEGDLVSLDGSTGEVFAGAVPVVDSAVVRWLEGGPVEDDLVSAVALLLDHADKRRRLDVRANADTPADAARARRFGASGIGLCRTEHMFLGERRTLVERLVLADGEQERAEALDAMLPLQRSDFAGILTAMDGLPVTVRLLDPPLHEFLPDLTELSVRVAVAEARGTTVPHDARLLAAVRRLHEQNPMLGLRGVRLGLVVPGLFATQARALLHAVADRLDSGGSPAGRADGSPGGLPPRARAGPGRAGAGPRRRRGRTRLGDPVPHRHHGRGAACGGHRRAHRHGRRLLLLRHQRPHPADLGVLARRRRGRVLLRVLRPRGVRLLSVRVARHRRRRSPGTGRHRGRAPREPDASCRRLRRARRRPALRALLRRGGSGLRVVLAVPDSGGTARGRPLCPCSG